jgi:hypothetical protein
LTIDNWQLIIEKPHSYVGHQSSKRGQIGVPSLIQTFTVGSGVSPDRPDQLSIVNLQLSIDPVRGLGLRGLTAGRELHPAPKVSYFFVGVIITAVSPITNPFLACCHKTAVTFVYGSRTENWRLETGNQAFGRK